MKKHFGFMIIMSIVLFSINSFAFQNEPDGFRGIKWGTNIKALKDMEIYRTEGETKYYTRKNDKMKIGNAQLDKIQYAFWQDKFIDVAIITRGLENYQALKNIVFAKFGNGIQKNKHIEEYSWGGKVDSKVWIELGYRDKKYKFGFLLISGSKIQKEKLAFEKQRDKQKAKQGENDF